MLESYAVGLGLIVAVSVLWVGVQLAWRGVFPATSSDPDVLAERMDCGGGCGCTLVCRREFVQEAVAAEEETR